MEQLQRYRFGPYTTEISFSAGFASLDLQDDRTPLLVFDEKSEELFAGKPCFSSLPRVVLPRGEESKSWKSVESILKRALEEGLARDSVLAGIGGGIICDLTAFAASVYMRGCRLALVPTTLLAMVDAALGGKTGFNFGGYKNMVGTFYPAERLNVITETLTTLPKAELLAGIAENIKHACLGEERLFKLLEEERTALLQGDTDILGELISLSIPVKAKVVEQDLRESGIRAHLNLGHTFAHALESLHALEGSGHGEAVAWGLAMAMKAGMAAGITDPAYGERVISLLRSYGYRLDREVDEELFLQAVRKDKKKRKGTVRFILQEDLGRTCIRELDESIVRRVISGQTS